MKKSFSLLELVFTLIIVSLVFSFIYIKFDDNKTKLAASKLVLFLKEARNLALIDSKKEISDELWHKKRWTLKFFNCRSSVGGLYYVIYSDENKTGHPSSDESLKDPQTGKYIYSTNWCTYNDDRSKYVLLTKEFDITDVEISCNSTTTIGQISFGSDGKIYSKLTEIESEYEIEETCTIELISENDNKTKIFLESKTGYVYQE